MQNTTVKIDKRAALMVAHRGLSAINTENTLPAFEYAGTRSHYGVECDVHITKDGKYVIFHDDDTGRLCDKKLAIEESAFAELRALKFNDDMSGKLCIPTLEEFLEIVAQSGKHAFIELKRLMPERNIREIIDICARKYDLNNITFISFELDNLVAVRRKDNSVSAMYLTCEINDDVINALLAHGLGLDVYWERLTPENIELLHSHGVAVNCWTCDDKTVAERLVALGVDYITTDILE